MIVTPNNVDRFEALLESHPNTPLIESIFFFFFLYHFIVRQVEPMMDFTCFTLKAGGKGDAAQGR